MSSGKTATYQALLDSPIRLVNGNVGKCRSTRVGVRNRDASEHTSPANMWSVRLGKVRIAQRVVGIRITMRPAIHCQPENVAVRIKARRPQHPIELCARFAL